MMREGWLKENIDARLYCGTSGDRRPEERRI